MTGLVRPCVPGDGWATLLAPSWSPEDETATMTTPDARPWAQRSSGPTRLWRGMTQRCPRCGARGIGDGFWELETTCHGCGWLFEREEGYWVGAMIVLLAAVEAIFGIFLLAGILLTWPDVPWSVLLYSGLVLNGVVPFLLYRWSKTTWMGLHTLFVEAVLEQDRPSLDGSA